MGATFTFDAPAPLLVVRFSCPDAVATRYTLTATRGLRVFDALAVKTVGLGAAGDGVKLYYGPNDVTDMITPIGMALGALAVGGAARAADVDDAHQVIPVGGELTAKITPGIGGNPACDVHVYCLPA